MASHRAVWKGAIRFAFLTVPVKAYTASASSSNNISLNQLHAGCNSRIQYKKVCPAHGEVKADEIVSGYEVSEGEYVVIDPEEIDKLRSPSEKELNIAAFVRPDALDPTYYSGATHYLAPEGIAAKRPYALVHQLMLEENRYAFAQVVLRGKEQVVLLRPLADLIAMTTLLYDAEVKKPTEFLEEVPKVDVPAAELKLAKSLVQSMVVEDFDFSQYKDKYKDNLKRLIEAKVAGEEIAAPAPEVAQPAMSLMEALQKSLAAQQAGALATAASGNGHGKPSKQAAP